MPGGTFYNLSNNSAAARYKRYIVGAKLYFGKLFTVPVLNISIKAPAPANNKLRVFNSFSELGAGLNANGTVEFIDVKKTPLIGNIILEPVTLNDLMEYDGNIYDYLKTYEFNCSFIWKGKRKYFRYRPSQMLMYVNYAEDENTYQLLKDNAAFEQNCNEFADMARENAKAIAAVAANFDQLPATLKQKIRLAVIRHKNTVDEFKRKLPAGYYVQTTDVPVDKFQDGSIGFIPVIVWVVAIITAGTVIALELIANRIADVNKQKNQLKANYEAVQQIQYAAEAYQQNKISREGYENVRTAANKNIEQGNQNLDRASKADAAAKESGGILGEVKQIVVIGGIIWIVKTLFSGNNNS